MHKFKDALKNIKPTDCKCEVKYNGLIKGNNKNYRLISKDDHKKLHGSEE